MNEIIDLWRAMASYWEIIDLWRAMASYWVDQAQQLQQTVCTAYGLKLSEHDIPDDAIDHQLTDAEARSLLQRYSQ